METYLATAVVSSFLKERSTVHKAFHRAAASCKRKVGLMIFIILRYRKLINTPMGPEQTIEL
jgi:hypothetical protein